MSDPFAHSSPLISCVKYGTCKQCAGIDPDSYVSRGSTPLLATDICMACHMQKTKPSIDELRSIFYSRGYDYTTKLYHMTHQEVYNVLTGGYYNKQNEEILIETEDDGELQELDYICKFYDQRKD